MESNPSIAFAENAVNAKFDDLGSAAIDRAKLRLADAVGVISAGSRGVGVDGMVSMIRKWGGPGEARLANYGDLVPVQYAAFINSIQIRSFDSEAVDAEGVLANWPAHVTSTMMPSALALADMKHMSGKEFLTTMLVGDDVACRLTEASRFDPLGCFDGNGTNNCMGATALAGRALGLSADQIHQAFGIAVNLAGGTMKSTSGSWTFKLGNAFSAWQGITAAQMAAEGYQGLENPFTDPKTFFDMFAPKAEPEDVTKDLGKRFYSDVVIKPWACCRGNHVVLDAARDCLGGRTFKASEIKHVKFGGTKSLTNGDFPFGTTCEVDGLFNRRFTLSTYILTGQVTTASYDPAWMTNPELGDLISKLEFFEWNPLAGKKGAGAMAACVDIELVNGEVLHGEVKGSVLGDTLTKPLSEEDFYAKFESNAKFGGKVDFEKLKEAYDMAFKIEEVADMHDFFDLLVP